MTQPPPTKSDFFLVSIPITYKERAECKSMTCLCGKAYISHHVKAYPACKVDGEFLIDAGFTVIISDIEGNITHCIRQCPTCKGLDLNHWGQQAYILEVFNSGEKQCTVSRWK